MVALGLALRLLGAPAWLIGLVGLAAFALTLGSIRHLWTLARTRRTCPPPARHVDLGGYRVHVLAEGKSHREVYVTGSPMREVLDHQAPKIAASTATADLGLEPGTFFVISAHREENVDHPARLHDLLETLVALHAEFGYEVVVSLHPRTRKRLEALRGGAEALDGVRFHPPFGFSDYLRLQIDAACVLSDSGTIAEESSMLGFRAVTLRDSIERPEALDAGSIILAGLKARNVLTAVHARMSDPAQSPSVPAEYQITDTSLRVRNMILSAAPRLGFWHSLHERRPEDHHPKDHHPEDHPEDQN